MYSLDFIKDNYEVLKDYTEIKGIDCDIDYAYQLTLDRSKTLKDIEWIHHTINTLNKIFIKLGDDDPQKHKLRKDLKDLSTRKKHIRKSQKEIDSKLSDILLTIPNIPNIALYHPSTRLTAKDTVQNEWCPDKYSPSQNIKVIPHYDMAQKLRIYDHNYTKKISAPKFMLYLPKGSIIVSKISKAMINFLHRHHYQRLFVSEVLGRDIVKKMGFFHEKQEMFQLDDINLQLSPSGHIGILNILSNMNLHKSSLPLKLFSLSNCFRKEIGGYGKENRGLLRMYQFLKNDSIIISDPDESYNEYDRLIGTVEEFIRSFDIPYRIISPSYRNTPFTASKTLFFESLLPSLNKWINIISVSNTEEFLSRRISLQFRNTRTKEKGFPHIIHWSGPSVERLIVLLLEYRQYEKDFDFEGLFS